MILEGHLLKESAANRGVIQYTLDFLSIPNNVIKKGRLHGQSYGKTPEKKEYHRAHNLKKRDASRRISKGSTIVSCEILNFVHLNSNMIELKKSTSTTTCLMHMVYRETFFANPQASSSAPCPQELNSTWKKTIEEPIRMSTAEKSERPEQNRDLRCSLDRQPKNLSSPVEETPQRIMGRPTTTADFRSSF